MNEIEKLRMLRFRNRRTIAYYKSDPRVDHAADAILHYLLNMGKKLPPESRLRRFVRWCKNIWNGFVSLFLFS